MFAQILSVFGNFNLKNNNNKRNLVKASPTLSLKVNTDPDVRSTHQIQIKREALHVNISQLT